MIAGSKRNFLALCIGESLNKACRFLALVLFARALAVDEFGILNVAIALSGIAVIVSSFGLPDLGVRDVAVAPQSVRHVAGRVISIRVTAVIAVVVATLGAVTLWSSKSHLTIVLIAGMMGIFMALSADWIARGTDHMLAVAIAAASGGLVVLAGALLLAPNGVSTEAALSAYVAGEAAAAGACWFAVRGQGAPRLSFSGAKPLLRRASPVAASAVLVYVYYANLDVVLISALRSPEEAGLYSAGYRIFLTLNIVPTFAAYAVFPTIARYSHNRLNEAIQTRVVALIRALSLYALVILAILELVGEPLLKALYGTEFAKSSTAFIVLVAAAAWYAIGFPMGYTAIARGYNRWYLEGAAIAGFLNLALNLVLIPPFGIVGAAVATLASFAGAALVWLVRAHGWDRAIAIPVLILAAATVGALLAAGGVSTVGIGLATAAVAAIWGVHQGIRRAVPIAHAGSARVD